MELSKSKFKKEEVELIVNKINLQYNSKLTECYNYLQDLKEENKRLSFELAEFKENDEIISSSIKEATKKSKETNLLTEKKYIAELNALKEFHNSWKEYFDTIFEKFPLYPAVKELKKVTDDIDAILEEDSEAKKKIAKIEKTLPKKEGKIFNPKSKIEEYVSATSDNGFNIDEVLNPGELKLEDICKELGLID